MSVIDILFIMALSSSVFSFQLKLPGNFLVFFHTAWYKLLSGNPSVTFNFLLTLLILAVGFEIIEYLVLAFTMRRAEASSSTIWFAITGSLIGSFSGLFSSFVLGSLIGGIFGVLLGALTGTLIKKQPLPVTVRIVSAAFVGSVGGMILKYIGVVIMVSLVVHTIYI